MERWVIDEPFPAGGNTPGEWNLSELRIVPGLRPESAASRSLAARERELDRRERLVRLRERSLAVVGYVVLLALALECVLALAVMRYGNERLAASMPPTLAGQRR